MITVYTKEESYAKWLGDGNVEFIQPTKEVSQDGLVTTITSRTDAQLVELGYQKFKVKTEGNPGIGKHPVESWRLDEDGNLVKTITWKYITGEK